MTTYSKEQIIGILKAAPEGAQYYTDGYDVKYRKVFGGKYYGYLEEAKGWVETCDKALSQERIDKGWWLVNLASLIENIPTETPEEKEVLDSIESAGEVEWKSGDECEIEMQEGVRRYLFGCECPNNQKTCIVFTEDGGGHMVMPIERLKKPETPQHRKDRERSCAIYDMCAEADIFTEESNFWAGKFYDLGYKKEKANGTN